MGGEVPEILLEGGAYAYSWAPCGVSFCWNRWQGCLTLPRIILKYPVILCCFPCFLIGLVFSLIKIVLWGVVDFILLIGTLLSFGCCGKSCHTWSENGCCKYDKISAEKECIVSSPFFPFSIFSHTFFLLALCAF